MVDGTLPLILLYDKSRYLHSNNAKEYSLR